MRRQTADATAAAASMHLAQGKAWPEFAALLVRCCSGDRGQRAAVLQILEQLRDEAEQGGAAEGTALPSIAEQGGASQGEGRVASLHALLASLEEHGGALHTLISLSLEDDGDRASRAAAARIYALCVTGAPEALREPVRDLAPVLAAAVSAPPGPGCPDLLGDLAEEEGTDLQVPGAQCESCLQAVTLSAHADPALWATLSVAREGVRELPRALAATVGDASLDPSVRSAALAALVELVDAVHAGGIEEEAAMGLAAEAVSAAVGVLGDLPADEATADWAEAIDEQVGAPGGEDGCASEAEALFDAALDAARHLASHAGAVDALRGASAALLGRESWQARHGGLLGCLQLAWAVGTDGAVHDGDVAVVAMRHFDHVHPRVRWAALEVWARLFSVGVQTPLRYLGEALGTLMDIAADDQYVRVRRRCLLVLVMAATSARVPQEDAAADAAAARPPLDPAQVAALFRRVLIPQAASYDPDIRQACADIGQALAVGGESPEGGGGAGAAEDAEFRPHWEELCAALARANEDEGPGEEASKIEWPADWR